MPDPKEVLGPQNIKHLTEVEGAKVSVSSDNRLQVEFRITELIKKLIPGGDAASSCGGCTGCMGCGH